MKLIRILNIVAIMNRGGLESMIMNHYRKINREKIQFDFLVHRTEKGAFDDEIKELGGRIYYVPQFNPFNIIKYNIELDNFFREHTEFNIVHSHYNALSMWALRAAKKNNVPVRIAHSHLAYPKASIKSIIFYYGRLNINNYCTHRLACSKNAAKWLYGKKYLSSAIIFKNAIDLDEFMYNPDIRDNYRSKLNIKKDLVFTHVGRFNKGKNHTYLLDIFNEIHTLNNNSTLLLVGDGVLRCDIETKVNNLNLSENVIFLGVRNDVNCILQASDAFIFPSIAEALPVALVEAQASGLPTFASDTITDEVMFSCNIEFLNIRENPRVWAEKILNKLNSYVRKDKTVNKQLKAYDITENVKWLESFYFDLLSEN